MILMNICKIILYNINDYEFMEDKNSKRLKTYLKRPVVIAVVIVMVSVSIFSAYVIMTPKDSYHNPNVSFQVSFSGNPSPAVIPALSGQSSISSSSPFYSYNMSNVSVRVFGISPYLEVQGSQSVTNNGSYIELFNASHASQSGMINGALSSSFLNIITEYSTLFSGNSGKNMIQSLDVDAQYQFAYQGKMYVYRYYNTLPFSPLSHKFSTGLYAYTFHLDMGFNMNQKPVVFNMSNATTSFIHAKNAGQIGPPGGNLNCENSVSSKVTTYWGPYIVNAAQITNGYGMTGLAETIKYISSGWVNTTSVQTCDQSSSGTIVGSNTAWGTGKNVSFDFSSIGVEPQSSRISHNNPQTNISMAVLQHFEYGIIFQVIKVFHVDGSYCEYIGTYNQTTVKVLNGNNDSLDIYTGSPTKAYNLPSNFTSNVTLINRYVNDTGYILYTIFAHKIIDTVNVPEGGQTNTFNYDFQSGTFSTSSTNYIKAMEESLNASQGGGINAFMSGNYALGVAGLGIDIALIGLALAIPTGGVGLAVAAVGLILAGIGLALSAAQTATVTYTFTWQTSSFSDIFLQNFATGQDPGFTTYFYSTQAVTWEFPNGSSAEVNMPNPYINMIAL